MSEPRVFIRPKHKQTWTEVKNVKEVGVDNYPKKMMRLSPPREIKFTIKLSKRERNLIQQSLRPAKYVMRALRDWQKGTRWSRMAMKEDNPIRRGYINHIAELKLRRAEMWKEMGKRKEQL